MAPLLLVKLFLKIHTKQELDFQKIIYVNVNLVKIIHYRKICQKQ